MLRVLAAALTLFALAGCGAPGAPEPRQDLSPPPGSVAVVGEI